jgi:hypothetical protein
MGDIMNNSTKATKRSDAVVLVVELLSSDLALRSNAEKLFSNIENRDADTVTVNFDNVTSITRSFAHEYITQRKKSDKTIIEINIPSNIEKMFQVVMHPERHRNIDIKAIKPISVWK